MPQSATRYAWAIMAALSFPAVSVSGPARAQQPASVFTAGNVRAEAEAADAVEAKRLALQQAETLALQRVFARVTDFRARGRLPNVSPEESARFVSDVEVRNEGVSGTGYVATFGVTFSERAVRSALAQYGLTPIETRGPEISILPVYIEGGSARGADRNPWRNALASLDLTHELVPAKLLAVRGDLTASIASAYAANPANAVETLKSQYRSSQIVMALAEADPTGERLVIKAIGSDALGVFSFDRALRFRDGVDERALQMAARLVGGLVQQRWKLTRDAGLVAQAAGGSGVAGSPDAAAASIEVTVLYTGLKEWQTIRGRLQKLPGVQNFDVKTVDPRAATIGLDFPGGAGRFAAVAEGQALAVEKGPGGITVRSR